MSKWAFDNEVIIKIEGDVDFGVEEGDYGSYGGYEGYTVTTNKRRINIGVSKGQHCCERTGYFTSEDDPKTFIGHRLIGIEVVDTALAKTDIEDLEYLDQGDTMFVNFNTDSDTLQFVVYNAHNGYYGHEATIEISPINSETAGFSKYL